MRARVPLEADLLGLLDPRSGCRSDRARLSWERAAACAGSGLDPDAWFPVNEEERGQAAMEVCGRCPVRTPCLAAAMARDERHGIWGGLTSAQRVALRVELLTGEAGRAAS